MGGCSKQEKEDQLSGLWRCEINLQQDSAVLPFFLEIIKTDSNYVAAIHNGDEAIVQPNLTFVNDTLRIPSPVFHTEIVAHVKGNEMTGYWQDYSRGDDYILPFKAKYNLNQRFSFKKLVNDGMDGKWAARFGEDSNSYPAIGLFKTDEHSTKGTFITETGDYRFLEGGFDGTEFKYSAFDGSHAFLFTGILAGDTLKGTFYSGKHHHENFSAWRDSLVVLQDPYTMTQLTSVNNRMNFNALLMDGKELNYATSEYFKKPMLIQIMGSWCPNCMDESVYLSSVYDSLKSMGIGVLAISFEREDFETAKQTLDKLSKNLKIPYPVLYGGHTGSDVADKLGFIKKLNSFPTLFYVLPEGKIFRIHTGFYGPGTGNYFEKQSVEMLDDFRNLAALAKQ